MTRTSKILKRRIHMKIWTLLAALALCVPLAPALAQGRGGEGPARLVDAVMGEDEVPRRTGTDAETTGPGAESAPLPLRPAPGAQPPQASENTSGPALPDPNRTPAEVVAEGPPPVFYDAQDAVPTGPRSRSGRPLKNLSADTDPGSAIIVVKKDAPGESPQAKLAAAQRAMALGRYEAALSLYDMLLARDKKDPEILMGRAVALHRLGRFDAAIETYERVLEVRPETVGAEVNMLGLMAERYPAVAIQRLRALHTRHPERTDILAQMAVAHGNLGNLDDALAALGMAAAAEPTNPLHLYNMAVLADRKGDKGQAVQYYEKALEVDSVYGRGESLPRADIYARLAQIR